MEGDKTHGQRSRGAVLLISEPGGRRARLEAVPGIVDVRAPPLGLPHAPERRNDHRLRPRKTPQDLVWPLWQALRGSTHAVQRQFLTKVQPSMAPTRLTPFLSARAVLSSGCSTRAIQSYGQEPIAESLASLTTPVASRALGGTRVASTAQQARDQLDSAPGKRGAQATWRPDPCTESDLRDLAPRAALTRMWTGVPPASGGRDSAGRFVISRCTCGARGLDQHP